MSYLPRVTLATREEVSREFDDLGPDACMDEIGRGLEQRNPELLDIVVKAASDLGSERIRQGFFMLYRALEREASLQADASDLNALPKVSPPVRDDLVLEIDSIGEKAFMASSVDELEQSNPELLQMAQFFAESHSDYLRAMQGFCLIYRALAAQRERDRIMSH